MTLFGKRKDGQAYPKRNKSGTKRKGSTKTSGIKLENPTDFTDNFKRIAKKVKHKDSEKICSRCDNRFDIDKSHAGRVLGNLPLCNNCNTKGLKPLGYPPHWVWNKMSIKEKQYALHDVGIPILDDHDYLHLDDFDDLPKGIRNSLRKKWGIEEE